VSNYRIRERCNGCETEVILTEQQTLNKFPWLKGGLGNMNTVTLSDHDGLLTVISEVPANETHQVVRHETRDGGDHGYFVHLITESLVYSDEECWTREFWGTEESCKAMADALNNRVG
jgi:hypothetical protein